MKRQHGQHTGLLIPNNLSVGMTLCEELHLLGNGCEYDGVCQQEETGICLRKQEDKDE